MTSTPVNDLKLTTTSAGMIRWHAGRLTLHLVVADDGPVLVGEVLLDGRRLVGGRSVTPLVELGVRGRGRDWSARRFLESVAGAGLRPAGVEAVGDVGRDGLVVRQRDEATGVEVSTELWVRDGAATVQVTSRVTNTARSPITLTWVTTAVVGGLLPDVPVERMQLHSAANEWLAENRWRADRLRDVLPYLNRGAHEHDPRGAVERTSSGAWPTDGWLPLGIVNDPASGAAVGWQIEHNGGWHWQLGERDDGLYVSLLGPTEQRHAWAHDLEPGGAFETVPATVAFSMTGITGVFEALTAQRRAGRAAHVDNQRLPVIFNDYMNTLMGDPTTAKLVPLVDAAAEVGAEVFVIDAGWYADDPGWWDEVGLWEPADRRFPGTLTEVLEHIVARGMAPGLWLEPEMVGVRSPLAAQLPDEAFFCHRGARLVEHGRHHLDFSHPAARHHMDGVVDRLVDLGARYFKLDYNVDMGHGSDVGGVAVGAGLLRHNRAYLAWLDGVRERHPELVLESCASGGMRVDYATLSRAQVQSTSDQQDPLLYPPIAAAAGAVVLPEQAASWAYPQPGHSDDLIAFTNNTAMLGRFYLSGHLDHMSPDQRTLVAEAVSTWKGQRSFIASATPFWPAGLPGWDDDWVCHGLRTDTVALVTAWRRIGASDVLEVDVAGMVSAADVTVLYPSGGDAEVTTTTDGSGATLLQIRLPRVPQSVTVRIELTAGRSR